MFRISRLAPLALLLAMVACQDNQLAGPQDGTTRIGTGSGFTLLLTDAPGDVNAAVVTISKIELQGTGGSVTLLSQPFTGDLLQLRNEVATLVSGLDIPAGSYSQLRLVLSGGYIEAETQHGTEIYASSPDYAGLPAGVQPTGRLVMPSMGTSGLKIDLPGGNLQVGAGETIVMIDFDVADSFGHVAGNSGNWVMHPVVKATDVTFGGNLLAQLRLGDSVTLPELGGQQLTLGDFSAVLTPVDGGAPAEIALADDGSGVFQALFKALVPGQYNLSFVAPSGLLVGYAPTLPVTVTVAQKETTTETVTLTSAALPGTITATLELGTNVTLPSIGTPAAPVTLAQFKAQLTPADGTPGQVAFSADSTGQFQASFPNLPPGDYSLTILNPAGTTITYDVTPPVAITLASGASETQNFTITAAQAQ